MNHPTFKEQEFRAAYSAVRRHGREEGGRGYRVAYPEERYTEVEMLASLCLSRRERPEILVSQELNTANGAVFARFLLSRRAWMRGLDR